MRPAKTADDDEIKRCFGVRKPEAVLPVIAGDHAIGPPFARASKSESTSL